VCFAASCVRSAACWPGSSAWSRACSPESAGCSAGSSERVTAPGVTFAEPIWLRGRERVSRRTVALRSPSTKRPSGSHAGEAVTFRKPEQRVRSRLSSRAAERTRPLDRRLPAAGHSRHARPRRRRAADLRRSLPRDEPRPAGVRPVVQRQGTTRHGANALSPVKAGLKAIPGRAHFTPMSPQRKRRGGFPERSGGRARRASRRGGLGAPRGTLPSAALARESYRRYVIEPDGSMRVAATRPLNARWPPPLERC
jgi:hypothetical protein